MTEPNPSIAEPGKLYSRAMDATRLYVANIRVDQLGQPTPCTEWNVRQVLNHIIYGSIWVERVFGGEVGPKNLDEYEGDLVGSDHLVAYDSACRSAKAAVLESGAMDTACHLSRGVVTGAWYAGSMFTDVLIHGWDIAVATGQDAHLDPELVAASYAIMMHRKGHLSEKAFGTDQNVSELHDLQTQLLGMLGRKADWAA